MHVKVSIKSPIREKTTWDERVLGSDGGLIACWERGREKALENPELAEQAKAGRLVVLPWKGGVERELKKKEKVGTLWYLAMWQGLRGEDLDVDLNSEPSLTCTATNMTVTYTADYEKYKNA